MELSDLLKLMGRLGASDLFVTTGAPISFKVDGDMRSINTNKLNPEDTYRFAYKLMNQTQREEFERSKELNFAIHPHGIGRFRVSVFFQRSTVAVVIRSINTQIPTFDELDLPEAIPKIAMQKQGLVLMVGGTGTGKSTTQAAMLGFRNTNASDHIITIEDPIEFLHVHRKSLVNQREVGIDTDSFGIALKNAMRQAPDVVQIGEIRDAQTMHDAIVFSETGHLCLATLHANNTYQALDRVLSFYSADSRDHLLMDLSLSLHAVVAQRLVPRAEGTGRIAAVEVMINTPLIGDIIRRGDFHQIPEAIERSPGSGSQTFDYSLFDLYCKGLISDVEALKNAESENNLRLKIKLEGPNAGSLSSGVNSNLRAI